VGLDVTAPLPSQMKLMTCDVAHAASAVTADTNIVAYGRRMKKSMVDCGTFEVTAVRAFLSMS